MYMSSPNSLKGHSLCCKLLGFGGGIVLLSGGAQKLKDFKPKHAIALSNFTILGGAIANTVVNSRPLTQETYASWPMYSPFWLGRKDTERFRVAPFSGFVGGRSYDRNLPGDSYVVPF